MKLLAIVLGAVAFCANAIKIEPVTKSISHKELKVTQEFEHLKQLRSHKQDDD